MKISRCQVIRRSKNSRVGLLKIDREKPCDTVAFNAMGRLRKVPTLIYFPYTINLLVGIVSPLLGIVSFLHIKSVEGNGHVFNTVDEFGGIGERTRIRKIG